MQVGDIMNREVVTVRPQDTFAGAAEVLRRNRISSVVVEEGEEGPAGILTERDVVALVSEGLDPNRTTVGERMTRELITVPPRTDVAEAARLMAERGVRHLPVVDRGRLVGMVSIRDLLAWGLQEVTGGHELPDMERGAAALSAAADLQRRH
jgi:CBS domain-containing protein